MCFCCKCQYQRNFPSCYPLTSFPKIGDQKVWQRNWFGITILGNVSFEFVNSSFMLSSMKYISRQIRATTLVFLLPMITKRVYLFSNNSFLHPFEIGRMTDLLKRDFKENQMYVFDLDMKCVILN